MLDVKYYKDYRHNYLILKDNGSLSENVYQRRMVTENKIKGLLTSQERYINGEILLYYEITSRQSLSSIYGGRSIGMEQLRKFFLQLKVVNDALQKYLLDSSCLILLPEYIFQNMETEEYAFLYYPDPEEGSLPQLLDFFMSKVNGEDMEAVETVYKIADLVGREQFVLDEVLTWFQEDEENDERKKEKEIQSYKPENKSILSQDGKEDEADGEDYEYGDPLSEKEEEEEEEKKGKIMKREFFVWGLGILAVGALLYAQNTFQLSYQEEISLKAGWILTAVLVPGLSAWIFWSDRIRDREKEKEAKDGKEETLRYCVSAYERETPAPSADSGNTVFIPWTESCENKLYSMDKKNKCHIDLERLPLTVGKLAGAVDLVINEQSLSRMHAKFSRTGKNIYITDLNSTNGTFRNGMRLTPNASEIIEPGDEIRLGKLKFIYR